MTDRPVCPVHKIPDCSPLLNGCTWHPVEVPTFGSAETTYVAGFDTDDQGRIIAGQSVDVPPFAGPIHFYEPPEPQLDPFVPGETVRLVDRQGKVVGEFTWATPTPTPPRFEVSVRIEPREPVETRDDRGPSPTAEQHAERESLWERISDDLPESFWRIATWVPGGTYVTGALDVADRRRIGLAVLTLAGEHCPPNQRDL